MAPCGCPRDASGKRRVGDREAQSDRRDSELARRIQVLDLAERLAGAIAAMTRLSGALEKREHHTAD